jgi:hypothetical protein
MRHVTPVGEIDNSYNILPEELTGRDSGHAHVNVGRKN